MIQAKSSKKVPIILTIFGVLLGLQIVLLYRAKPKMEPLPELSAVPDFRLVNPTGDTLGLDQFKGSVWVADFIFTTCGGPCPQMTRNMAAIQKDFSGKSGLQFLSVSVNPEYDTPDIMGNYAEEFEADTSSWKFLTGAKKAIRDLAIGGFKLGLAEDIVTHSTRFALVDKNGTIRGYYNGTDDGDMKKLRSHIKTLL